MASCGPWFFYESKSFLWPIDVLLRYIVVHCKTVSVCYGPKWTLTSQKHGFGLFLLLQNSSSQKIFHPNPQPRETRLLFFISLAFGALQYVNNLYEQGIPWNGKNGPSGSTLFIWPFIIVHSA